MDRDDFDKLSVAPPSFIISRVKWEHLFSGPKLEQQLERITVIISFFCAFKRIISIELHLNLLIFILLWTEMPRTL